MAGQFRFFVIIVASALILNVSCSRKPQLSFQNEFPEQDPFIDYDRYVQQDLLYAGSKKNYNEQIKQVISALNEMGFSVDSVVALENYVFIRTPFTFKNDYFQTPKHQYLKVSLLIEVPRRPGMALQIKYAICTTCARCEKWYCDELPAWAEMEEYKTSESVQKLIFDFRKKLKSIREQL